MVKREDKCIKKKKTTLKLTPFAFGSEGIQWLDLHYTACGKLDKRYKCF